MNGWELVAADGARLKDSPGRDTGERERGRATGMRCRVIKNRNRFYSPLAHQLKHCGGDGEKHSEHQPPIYSIEVDRPAEVSEPEP